VRAILLAVFCSGAAFAGDVKGKLAAAPPEGGAVVFLVPADPKAKLPAPKTSRVSQKGARFNPKVMAVQLGAPVDFTNDDWVTHSVYSKSPAKAFDLGLYEKNAKKVITFDQPGEIDLLCSLHPRMHATLVVVPSAWFAAVGDDGSFSVEQVPAGKYDLVLHPVGGSETRKSVEVPASGAVTAAF
jgi:plastocyanin